jgi:hypothetical protein
MTPTAGGRRRDAQLCSIPAAAASRSAAELDGHNHLQLNGFGETGSAEDVSARISDHDGDEPVG